MSGRYGTGGGGVGGRLSRMRLRGALRGLGGLGGLGCGGVGLLILHCLRRGLGRLGLCSRRSRLGCGNARLLGCRLRLLFGGCVAILRLVDYIVFQILIEAEQLVERHAVQLCERNEISGVGRRFRALPLRYRLAGQSEPFGKLFLAVALLASQLCEALGDLDVHEWFLP